jgi:hypothetical protein
MSDKLEDDSPHDSKSTKKHSETIATHPASQNTFTRKHTPSATGAASCKYYITAIKEPT